MASKPTASIALAWASAGRAIAGPIRDAIQKSKAKENHDDAKGD